MTLKNDAKFGEELTCRFKINMCHFTDFNPSTRKSQKFGLQCALFLTRVYKLKKQHIGAKKVQRSYD